jgi:hypothetical protein
MHIKLRENWLAVSQAEMWWPTYTETAWKPVHFLEREESQLKNKIFFRSLTVFYAEIMWSRMTWWRWLWMVRGARFGNIQPWPIPRYYHSIHLVGMCKIAKNLRQEYRHIGTPAQNRSEVTNSAVLVRKRTIPTERPQPVGEVSANS